MCHQQRLSVSVSLSPNTYIISGVLQGSILGPILFKIYINDVNKLPFSHSPKLTLYADMSLSKAIQSPFDLSSLQGNINQIYAWSQAQLLKFNAKNASTWSSPGNIHVTVHSISALNLL